MHYSPKGGLIMAAILIGGSTILGVSTVLSKSTKKSGAFPHPVSSKPLTAHILYPQNQGRWIGNKIATRLGIVEVTAVGTGQTKTNQPVMTVMLHVINSSNKKLTPQAILTNQPLEVYQGGLQSPNQCPTVPINHLQVKSAVQNSLLKDQKQHWAQLVLQPGQSANLSNGQVYVLKDPSAPVFFKVPEIGGYFEEHPLSPNITHLNVKDWNGPAAKK